MVLPCIHDLKAGIQLSNGQRLAISRTYRAFSVINQHDGRDCAHDNETFPVSWLPQNSLVNSKKSLPVQMIVTRPCLTRLIVTGFLMNLLSIKRNPRLLPRSCGFSSKNTFNSSCFM